MKFLAFRKKLFFAALLICALFNVPIARAHPHAWIDYQTTVVFDDQHHITALKEHWLFDEYYTEFALKDFPHKGKNLDHETLLTLGRENLNNLKEYDYFTTLEEDGKEIHTNAPTNIASYLVRNRIALDFTLPLIQPTDPTKHKFSYRIYDPSYYVSMLHTKDAPIQFTGQALTACTHDLMTPKPDIMKINFAASIDKNGKAPNQLGSFFAQRMTITCP